MKKFIQKFTALITCTTLMMSISSRVYADTYESKNVDPYGISLCSSDEDTTPLPIPNPPANRYK